jgi:hypothetical protein
LVNCIYSRRGCRDDRERVSGDVLPVMMVRGRSREDWGNDENSGDEQSG